MFGKIRVNFGMKWILALLMFGFKGKFDIRFVILEIRESAKETPGEFVCFDGCRGCYAFGFKREGTRKRRSFTVVVRFWVGKELISSFPDMPRERIHF